MHATRPDSTVRSTVQRGRGYHGLAAWDVVNPDGDRFHPGRTVMVIPAHEEAPGWRAILAGYDEGGSAYVVPLCGHFGELSLRKLGGVGSPGLCLSLDEPFQGTRWATGDEADWNAAKVLALSTAYAFGLVGQQ